MRRRSALLGMWVVATAIATALAWAAVQQVTAGVARPARVTASIAAESDAATADAPTAGASAPASPADTQTVDLVGGSVTVRFTPAGTELVAATPRTGFTAEVRNTGPERVDVRFRSDDHESRLQADQEDGQRRVRPDEDDDG